MLYTKKGDTGTTILYGTATRFSKASDVIEVLGSLDELNSYLGICRVSLMNTPIIHSVSKKDRIPLRDLLHGIQEALFIIQANIAGAKKTLSSQKIRKLEKVTNVIETIISPIHSFTIPNGSLLSVHFDFARTLSRRAERTIVALHEQEGKKVHKNILAYMNRLSSVLFACARYSNHVEQVREEAPSYT